MSKSRNHENNQERAESVMLVTVAGDQQHGWSRWEANGCHGVRFVSMKLCTSDSILAKDVTLRFQEFSLRATDGVTKGVFILCRLSEVGRSAESIK